MNTEYIDKVNNIVNGDQPVKRKRAQLKRLKNECWDVHANGVQSVRPKMSLIHYYIIDAMNKL